MTLACLFAPLLLGAQDASDWTPRSPRDEIRPAFSRDPKGSLVITHDAREGLDGWYERAFPVTGGGWYAFRALRKTEGVAFPRRSAMARIVWLGADGRIPRVDPADAGKDGRPVPTAEPEHPRDGAVDAQGWTSVAGVFHAPPKAVKAVVELHLQWAPNGRAEWSEPVFEEGAKPPSRTARLAAVHYIPKGKSPKENREEFAPLLAEAAKQRADLVVLGETVPSARVARPPHELAEPVPGPTTEFFGELAKTHRLHVALSLYERDAHLVYNAAVLLGPDGRLLGKYRKVCLPHGEVEKGIAPGKDFPVFDTAFGKVGLMVCYDGFFPEVARQLANRGAEVIAWPVWGCDPLLAQARAAENRVHLVSSTFMDAKADWMISAVFNPAGRAIATADAWGTVAVAEVDLNRPFVGPYNLGDFGAMVPRHRPAEPGR